MLAVKAPGFGDRRKEMLRDIAILTGGNVITEELGRKLDTVTLEDLGRARRVVSTKDDTTIVEGRGDADAIKGRIDADQGADRGRPPPTTTARSCRSGWPSWPAAWRSSRSAPRPRSS